MPIEETVSSELTDDAFDLAFEAAVGGEPEPVITEPIVAEPVVLEPAPTEPVVAEPVVPEPVVAEHVVPEPVVATPVVPEPVVPIAPVGPTPEELAAAALEQPTEEEAALIASTTADFPEVLQVMKIQERVFTARFNNLLASKIAATVSQLDQRIAPALATSQSIARTKHEEAILAGHADAFTVLPKVEEWVKTQPVFLQPAYNNVLDNGTAAEIVALFSLFKKETGVQKVVPPSEKTPEQVEKEKRLKSQEGVRGRHAVQQTTVDPNDFDGAFDTYAKA